MVSGVCVSLTLSRVGFLSAWEAAMLGEDVLVLAKVAGEKAEIFFLHFCNIWMDFWGSEGLFFHSSFLKKEIL